uniref:Uncharacterized protein n=1 Tax=Rhizophora mucronata TaxID=61149 RepID=A0A2P2N1E8_RHIMU
MSNEEYFCRFLLDSCKRTEILNILSHQHFISLACKSSVSVSQELLLIRVA